MNHWYEIFADLLEYPDERWVARLVSYARGVDAEGGALAPPFLEFCRQMGGFSVAALQETYTLTFDLNPVCTLEIGYHLFGENYKRGLFLANLRETESPYELGQERQLPDYLPVLLRLLGKLEDAELRGALLSECLAPAVDKMVEALAKAGSPYGGLLALLAQALAVEAGDRRAAVPPAEFQELGAVPELYRISSRLSAR